MRPSQTREIVAQGFGQVAHVAISTDAERTVTLAQLGAVRPVNEWNMGEGGHLGAEGDEQVLLTSGVVEMVITANDMGDRHVDVVDHHREHVGGGPIGAKEDHVVELGCRHPNLALDEIANDRLALERCFEAQHGIDAQRCFRRIAVAPATIVEHRPAGGLGLRTHGLELVRRAPAAIGLSFGEKPLGGGAMPIQSRRLVDGLRIGNEPQPIQTFENRSDGTFGRAPAIGIFDPQQELATVVPSEQPVEECGARSTDMQIACG